MTDQRHTDGNDDADRPLDPWLTSLVEQATDVAPEEIPRDMMWARIQQRRRAGDAPAATDRAGAAPAVAHVEPLHFAAPVTTSTRTPQPWMMRAAGIAALLVGRIGIGRYLLPATGPSKYQTAIASSASRADSIRALGLGPEALAALPQSSEPVQVAMEEHLARTVALLTAVRDEDPMSGPGADLGGWARDLLGTTRVLLDEPQLRDERTRRLLQDLELVLVQIVQARRSAPETKRAPSETMRETNLLPRVRAAVTASRRGDDPTLGGGL